MSVRHRCLASVGISSFVRPVAGIPRIPACLWVRLPMSGSGGRGRRASPMRPTALSLTPPLIHPALACLQMNSARGSNQLGIRQRAEPLLHRRILTIQDHKDERDGPFHGGESFNDGVLLAAAPAPLRKVHPYDKWHRTRVGRHHAARKVDGSNLRKRLASKERPSRFALFSRTVPSRNRPNGCARLRMADWRSPNPG